MSAIDNVKISNVELRQNVKIDVGSTGGDQGDVGQFTAALNKHISAMGMPSSQGTATQNVSGLSDMLVKRATDFANDVKHDHLHVSEMLEKAAASGDQETLLKAMRAMTDYEMKVQFISKTVSKASSSIDQLTRMQ